MRFFAFGGQLVRFQGEQSEYHDGELVWPGYKGFPVLAKFFTPVDNNLYLTWVHFFHSKLFDLSNEKDREHYQWVNDRIVNGWFLPITREIKREDDKVRIYLEWVQRYLATVDPTFISENLLLENSHV